MRIVNARVRATARRTPFIILCATLRAFYAYRPCRRTRVRRAAMRVARCREVQ